MIIQFPTKNGGMIATGVSVPPVSTVIPVTADWFVAVVAIFVAVVAMFVAVEAWLVAVVFWLVATVVMFTAIVASVVPALVSTPLAIAAPV